ncbi:hypothetical protein DFH07DRAFT_781173 [Mycena maculata]|uniref:Uncharacterized protein n=1 Tax=Mycena maculata TaxID=230809 RepID=A0AAD7I0W5_9AGAR|nr:hypothetical protein DFH07DRAFT_781173 [Mycena maculata]
MACHVLLASGALMSRSRMGSLARMSSRSSGVESTVSGAVDTVGLDALLVLLIASLVSIAHGGLQDDASELAIPVNAVDEQAYSERLLVEVLKTKCVQVPSLDSHSELRPRYSIVLCLPFHAEWKARKSEKVGRVSVD